VRWNRTAGSAAAPAGATRQLSHRVRSDLRISVSFLCRRPDLRVRPTFICFRAGSIRPSGPFRIDPPGSLVHAPGRPHSTRIPIVHNQPAAGDFRTPSRPVPWARGRRAAVVREVPAKPVPHPNPTGTSSHLRRFDSRSLINRPQTISATQKPAHFPGSGASLRMQLQRISVPMR
jgi:hypothetical protein